MSKCIRLAVFTFFAVFVFIMCGESHARPGMDGIDENGRRVNVMDVDRYLKQNPYRPPAKKAPSKKPAPKKPAPKKPAPKKSVPKKPAPKPKYTKFDFDDVLGDTVVGTGVGALLAPFSGGTSVAAGAGLGAAGGALSNTGKWIWKNKKKIYIDVNSECGKIAKIEDPMGKSFPN